MLSFEQDVYIVNTMGCFLSSGAKLPANAERKSGLLSLTLELGAPSLTTILAGIWKECT